MRTQHPSPFQVRITDIVARDIRFPTSRNLDGSDAVNKDPDYSCVYVTLKTELIPSPAGDVVGGPHIAPSSAGGNGHGRSSGDVSGSSSVATRTTPSPDVAALPVGNGLTFTIGRGNEIVLKAVDALKPQIVSKPLSHFTENFGQAWHDLAFADSQLRWVGPEKGVVHLALGAVVNALWDLWAKICNKPLWKLVSDMSAEELVKCVDFTYITDCITAAEAVALLTPLQTKKAQRVAEMEVDGYPCYTTSPGWLGYSDEKLRTKCREALKDGFRHVKLKVGACLEDDLRRCRAARAELGGEVKLMVDANARWEVDQAVEWMRALEEAEVDEESGGKLDLWWIEEPTCCDDVLGHKTIREHIRTRVATGEMAQNRVTFKQLLMLDAIDVVQIDFCRVGGVNEVLAILLMAAKHKKPVCPHAGGVGLCEYVNHLSLIDYCCISGSLEDRVTEFVDHLHEHFVDPCVVKGGRYQAPRLPGYSIDMREESLADHEWPGGKVWRDEVEK